PEGSRSDTHSMPLAPPASALLKRIRPWLSKAVHVRWTLHRSFYQREAESLLHALSTYQGRMPPDLALRLEGFRGGVDRESRGWLAIAQRWWHPPQRARRTSVRANRPPEPLSKQSPLLLSMLSLPRNCTRTPFLTAWRRFLKENHPDLNPGQSAEERRRFAEAVSLWRR